jgi:hypothetical protein
MSIPDFTVVLGLDKVSLDQLRLTIPTWRRHKPSIFRSKFCVFADWTEIDHKQIREVLGPDVNAWIHDWPWSGYSGGHSRAGGKLSPQRAMMLSGFMFIPTVERIETPWWLKLDADCIATSQSDWISPDWFSTMPSYIAPPWGYTVGADWISKLDDWGDTIPGLKNFKRLDLPYTPGDRTIRHPRMAGWCSFYNTGFSNRVARLFDGIQSLPVPSQDTLHWYCAARWGWCGRHVNMRQRGWTNLSNETRMRAAVAAAMKTEPIHG